MGATYKLHMAHAFAGGGNLIADATVTVVAGESPGEVALDVNLAEASVPGRRLYGDLRLRGYVPPLDLPLDPSTDGIPWFPHPDPEFEFDINGVFHTFSMYVCMSPQEAHATGDKWRETRRIHPGWDVSVEWEAGATEVDDDGVWANYRAHMAILTEEYAPQPCYDVALRMRVDDGFIGECTVDDLLLGPAERSTSRITSTRVE